MSDPAGHEIDERLSAWEARLDDLEAPRRESRANASAAETHLVLVSAATGYLLVERDGAAPSAGEVLELNGETQRYTVSRVARSPLPGDARRCAFTLAI